MNEQSTAKKSAINELVRRKIREIRISRNFAVKEVATRAGLPISSYASMENGDYKINLDNLFSILGVLEADITDVWPAEAVGVQATGTNLYLMRMQEFRLNEVISLAGAEGGALFCLRRNRKCSVLLSQHLSDFLLDRLILYLESGEKYQDGLWWEKSHQGIRLILFLKGQSCPQFVEKLVDHYMVNWCALLKGELFRERSEDRELEVG